MSWTITPLHTGTLHRKRRNFLYLAGDDTPIDVPVIMFLLENGTERVLVDTGCSNPDTTHQHHPFERPADQHPLAVLASRGIAPETIDIVITSHLHWDHSSGNHLFPEARLFVQRREHEYARDPLQWHRESYETANPDRGTTWALDRYELLDGDTELLPGLTTLLTPGHTPGIQAVLVETGSALRVLAGDNVPTYDNWIGHLPEWSHIPATNHYNLAEYDATFRLLESTGAEVLPSHDFRVLEQSTYA